MSKAKTASIYDRHLNKTKHSEVKGIQDLEKKLSDLGYKVGIRTLELAVYRDSSNKGKRELKVLGILSFVHSTFWKSLFGKNADALEKSTDNEDEYMLSDNEPLVARFVSVPRDLQSFSTGAFLAGMVEAVLDASQFPCKVTAHSTATDQFPLRTTLLIKFDKSVIAREKS